MEENKKTSFGFVEDTDENLKSKENNGGFGLNKNVYMTKFELNPNAGIKNTPTDALDITFMVESTEYKTRFYEPNRVVDKNNNEITDKSSNEYISKFNEGIKQLSASIVHILKCFEEESKIKDSLSKGSSSFGDYIKLCVNILPPNFDKIKLDLFLEYQWNIKGNAKVTFLQVPKNMKGGYWLCRSVEGDFKEERIGGKLKYIDKETERVHPFERNKNFMESKKAYQQRLNVENNQNTFTDNSSSDIIEELPF